MTHRIDFTQEDVDALSTLCYHIFTNDDVEQFLFGDFTPEFSEEAKSALRYVWNAASSRASFNQK